MTVHVCKRCGYEGKLKHHLISHLQKKNKCEAINEDVTIESLLNEIDPRYNNITYDCIHCNRTFNDKSNLSRHEKVCKKNHRNKKEIVNNQLNSTPSVEEYNKLKQDLLFYKNKKKEAFYQGILEKFLLGTHKKLASGITDVTTDACHAEIKEWSSYKEGIGQLMTYNICDPKERLEMYMFGNYSNNCKDAAANIISACKINLYEFVHRDDGVDIVNYSDKSIVYSYLPTF
jgi:predicted transposase YbfD/YdcC